MTACALCPSACGFHHASKSAAYQPPAAPGDLSANFSRALVHIPVGIGRSNDSDKCDLLHVLMQHAHRRQVKNPRRPRAK
jgi:hypothetical protein